MLPNSGTLLAVLRLKFANGTGKKGGNNMLIPALIIALFAFMSIVVVRWVERDQISEE